MQDGEKHRPFDGELKLALAQELSQNLGATGFLPKALEDKRGADAACGDRGRLATAVRGEQQDMLGEARPGGKQAIELTSRLKLVESSQGDEDALAHAALGAGVFHDLEILSGSGLLDAEEHGGLAK